MRYLSVEEARKKAGSIGVEETVVTNHGKPVYFALPPKEMAEYRLFKRTQRLKESRMRVEAVMSSENKLSAEDIP